MEEAIEIEVDKSYRERCVQLNKPVQCEGNSSIYRKNSKIASMCVARIARCGREMWPYQPGVEQCASSRDKQHEEEAMALQPQSAWIGKWECQSDRSQVIGGEILIGQLAPWVTWDI